MTHDVTIAFLAIRTFDLWIGRRVWYPLQPSAQCMDLGTTRWNSSVLVTPAKRRYFLVVQLCNELKRLTAAYICSKCSAYCADSVSPVELTNCLPVGHHTVEVLAKTAQRQTYLQTQKVSAQVSTSHQGEFTAWEHINYLICYPASSCYDVMVFSPPGDAARTFAWRMLKERPWLPDSVP